MKENLMRTVARSVVGAMILSTDGRILLARRGAAKGGVYPALWQFPGGGIEEGESPTEAIIREVFEETGLAVSNMTIELLDDLDHDAVIRAGADGVEEVVEMSFAIYRILLPGTAADTSVVLGEEFQESRWVQVSELPELELVPAGVRFFQRRGML